MRGKLEQDQYRRYSHSVFRMTYHAVFVTKYRRRVITPEIMEFMKKHTEYLLEKRFEGELIEFNGEEDHIHILFELPPKIAPVTVICSLKTQLSKEVRNHYGDEIRDKLWKDSFWSKSYFLTTTGGVNIETLENYIQEQGTEQHKRKYTNRRKK